MRAQPTIRARPLLRFGEPPQACESSEQAGSFSLTDSSEQAGSFSLTTLATPAALHDYFNLAVTTTVVVLVMLAHTVHPRWNRPLAIVMCAYLVLDSAWLAIQPEIFGGGSAGGEAGFDIRLGGRGRRTRRHRPGGRATSGRGRPA